MCFSNEAFRKNVMLSDYTTLRVGGPADYFFEPESIDMFRQAAEWARQQNIPTLILGNGSNTLVLDGGYRGLVIHLGKKYAGITLDGCHIRACSGALLNSVSRLAAEYSLTGMEFAFGIPGSVGGAVYMNAGAYGGEISGITESVTVYDGERVRVIPGTEMQFAYRSSLAMKNNWTVLEADFILSPGSKDEIDARIRELTVRRKEKQPLEFPSAGSFFKRPEGYYAGALIEQSGLKGLTVGGAQVSEKHAGFLINIGGATARDFILLKEKIQKTVFDKFGVHLEPEVRIVGCEV